MSPASKGLTAHYFFTFGVEVQLVGDRKNTRVDQRILHLDVAAAALKLVQKGSVVVFLRFDAINQIVFDDAEPRSILISCRDDRRFFIVFQSVEDNLVFRTACADLAAKRLDLERFQRSVLRKGQLLKRGKAGALFGDRYGILTPRKLFILASKVSVFPSNAISLQEVSPRYDDAKGTIHLDVCGKEYVLQGTDKDSSQEWFVDIARAATSKVPILAWEDDPEPSPQEGEGAADGPDDQEGGRGWGDGDQQDYMAEQEELLSLSGIRAAGRSRQSHGPTHFTEPVDWEEQEELETDHHTEALHTHTHANTRGQQQGQEPSFVRHSAAAQHARPGSSNGTSTPRGPSPSAGQAMGQHRRQQQQQQKRGGSNSGLHAEGSGGVVGRGQAVALRSAPGGLGGAGTGGNSSMTGAAAAARNSRPATRSWSGGSNTSAASRQQQQQRGPLVAAQGHQVFRSSSGSGSGSGGHGGSNGSSRSGSGNGMNRPQVHEAGYVEGPPSVTGSALDTIYEARESDGMDGTHSDPTHPASGTAGYTTAADDGGEMGAGDEGGPDEQQGGEGWHQEDGDLLMGDNEQQQQQGYDDEQGAEDEAAAAAEEHKVFLQQQAQQQRQQRQFAPPPPAPPLRLSKVRATPQQQQRLLQQQQQQEMAARSSFSLQPAPRRSLGPASIAASAAAAANKHAAMQQQQQMAAAAAAAAAAVAQQQQQDAGTMQDAADVAMIAAAAAAAAASSHQQQQLHHSFAASGGFLSPRTQIDLSAVTEAVAARLISHQKQEQLTRQQQQQQHVQFADSFQRQQQQQAGFAGSPTAYSPDHTIPAAAAPSNTAVYSPYSTNSSPPGGATGTSWGTNSTINYGSGSGAQAPGSIPGSNTSSTDGWGRKSLAGLYSSSAVQRTANIGGTGADGSGSTAAGGYGQLVGDYSGLQNSWGAEAAAAAAAAAASMQPANPATMQGMNMYLHTAPAAGVQGYPMDSTAAAAAGVARPSIAARPGSSGSTSSASSGGGGGRGGVVLGEYIIPSVLRVVVRCPEGQGLAVQLAGQAQLTPHQRCLAMLRWAFGVYRQLPQEARTAIPSGPRRKSLKAWTAPDLTTLSRSIRTSQLTQKMKQRQEDRVNQQAEQQELLQETVLKQQQQLDQLAQLLAQSSAEGGLSPSRSVSQGLSLNPSAGSVGEQGFAGLVSGLFGSAAKLMPLTATTVLPDGSYNWAAYTRGFKAASEALAAAAATAAGAGLDGGSSSSSVSHLQQLILQRQQQQQLRQQHIEELPPQLLQLLASTASASGAQTATAVAAATAAAAAASKLPAGSIALLLQEAAANLLSQQQEQQCCWQGHAAANMQAGHGLPSSKQRSTRRSGQNLQGDASGSTAPSAAAVGVTQQDASSAVPQRALYRSSTSSSTASSTAEATTGEQYQPRGKSLAPVSFDLPPMSMSVHLRSFQADDDSATAAAAAAVPGRVSAVLSSRQYQQQQQAADAGVRLSGAHKLKGRCSFTVDNPLFHLEGLVTNKLNSDPAVASAAAAVGALSAGSSGRSLGSHSSRSAVYLSPAAAETICQAATAAAAAAAAAVRSAVIKLDGEDLLAAGDSHGCRPHSTQSLVGAVACDEMQLGDFVAAVAGGRAGALLRPGDGSN